MDSVPVVERSIHVFRSKTNSFYIEWCCTHLKDYLLPWKELMSCHIWKGRTAWFPGEKLCFGASALHGRPCVQMASVALCGKCCLFLEKIVPWVLLSSCLGKNS
jgi:hypothetical protein